MARQKLPDRVIGIEDRKRGLLRYRLHYVERGRRVARGYATAEEAEEAAARYTRLTAPLHSEAVSKAMERYFDAMVRVGRWRREAKAYASKTGVLRTFLAPVASVAIGSVTPGHIDRCCKAWDTPSRSGAWTRHNARVRARAFFNWAVRSKLLKVSPMGDEHATPMPRHQCGHLRMDEARQLRAVVDPAAARGDHSAIFVLTVLLIGARTSEMLGLRRRSLDDGGRVLCYRDAKNPAVTHKVRLPQVLVGPMAYLAREADDDEPLFDTHCRHPQTWGARAVRRWAKEAGLEGAGKMDARWLRRSKDTLAVEAGVSAEVVARETGHSLHVARKHYIAPGSESTAAAAAMDEATRDPGNVSSDNGTERLKVAK